MSRRSRCGSMMLRHIGQTSCARDTGQERQEAGKWTRPTPAALAAPGCASDPTRMHPRSRGARSVPALLADLRRVIELPVDLGEFDEAARHKINRFLHRAKGMGADKSCVACHRRA